MTGVTTAEIAVVANAELLRGDGEITASPMGLIPSVGAQNALLTLEPDLMLSDGNGSRLAITTGGDDERVVEGWQPFRKMLETVVPHGARHVMMGANQIDRYGNQNIPAFGDHDKPPNQLHLVLGRPR